MDGNAVSVTAAETYPLLEQILNDPASYKALLDVEDKEAQVAIGIMQKVLDIQGTPHHLKRATLYAMVRLCRESGTIPRSLILRNVEVIGDQPVNHGGFGDIWKGRVKTTTVCLKVARVTQKSDYVALLKDYVRERIVWSQLSHPNVLPFYGIFPWGDPYGRISLVSPWLENGNISEYLRNHPEVPRLPLIFDVCEGLKYLHQEQIVHEDLKSGNILITSSGNACLADFGLASILETNVLRWTSLKTIVQIGGTIRWQAPELMDELEDGHLPRPTFASDVYSLGCVMYEIFTGNIPFHEYPRDTTVLLKVMQGAMPSKPPQDAENEMSDETWQLMQELWSATPDHRPSITAVIERMYKIPETDLTKKRCKAYQLRKGRAQNSSPQTFRTIHDYSFFSPVEKKLLLQLNRKEPQDARPEPPARTASAGTVDASEVGSSVAERKRMLQDSGLALFSPNPSLRRVVNLPNTPLLSDLRISSPIQTKVVDEPKSDLQKPSVMAKSSTIPDPDSLPQPAQKVSDSMATRPAACRSRPKSMFVPGLINTPELNSSTVEGSHEERIQQAVSDKMPGPSSSPTAPVRNKFKSSADRRSISFPLAPAQNENLNLAVGSVTQSDAVPDRSEIPPWKRIETRLMDWLTARPYLEIDAAVKSTAVGQQFNEVALKIWATQIYKRYIRTILTGSPTRLVERLFVPPDVADAINAAVLDGRYKGAADILKDLWVPLGFERKPKFILAIAKHYSKPGQCVVHRFSLNEKRLTTYASHQRRDPPGALHPRWWSAIHIAWPPVDEDDKDPESIQKPFPLKSPEGQLTDYAVIAAGTWQNLLLGYRPDHAIDFEGLRKLIRTDVKRLQQLKQKQHS